MLKLTSDIQSLCQNSDSNSAGPVIALIISAYTLVSVTRLIVNVVESPIFRSHSSDLNLEAIDFLCDYLIDATRAMSNLLQSSGFDRFLLHFSDATFMVQGGLLFRDGSAIFNIDLARSLGILSSFLSSVVDEASSLGGLESSSIRHAFRSDLNFSGSNSSIRAAASTDRINVPNFNNSLAEGFASMWGGGDGLSYLDYNLYPGLIDRSSEISQFHLAKVLEYGVYSTIALLFFVAGVYLYRAGRSERVETWTPLNFDATPSLTREEALEQLLGVHWELVLKRAGVKVDDPSLNKIVLNSLGVDLNKLSSRGVEGSTSLSDPLRTGRIGQQAEFPPSFAGQFARLNRIYGLGLMRVKFDLDRAIRSVYSGDNEVRRRSTYLFMLHRMGRYGNPTSMLNFTYIFLNQARLYQNLRPWQGIVKILKKYFKGGGRG